MYLLVCYHRRFLLRKKFGIRWRGALVDLAAQRGLSIDGTSISHVISGDWRSKKIEQFLADTLSVPLGELWPEYKPARTRRGSSDYELTQGAA